MTALQRPQTPDQAPASDPRYRFLARFGATILSGGIAAIPMAIYHYQAELGLAPQEVWFVGYILAHRWTAALPYPSLRQMSRRTGISTQMLHRYKQSLIEKGYLERIPRHRPSGGRTSNYYDFSGLFQALEQRLVRDRRGAGWQPTADEADDPEDLEDPDALDGAAGAGPRAGVDPEPLLAPGPIPLPPAAPSASARLRRAPVPQSQHDQSARDAEPGQQGEGGRQLELIGQGQRALPGARSLRLIGADEPAPTGSDHPVRLPESRVTGSEYVNKEPAAHEGKQPARPAPQNESKRPLRNDENVFSPGALCIVGAKTSPQPQSTVLADPPRTADSRLRTQDSGLRASPEERWHQATETLAGRISEAALRSWILPLQPLAGAAEAAGAAAKVAAPGAAEGALTLVCPTAFHRDQVTRRYRDQLEAALGAPVELVLPALDPPSPPPIPAQG